MAPVRNIDGNLWNSDWIKALTWDGPLDLLTEEALERYLNDVIKISLEDFKKLPAYLGWRRYVARVKRERQS